MSSDVRSIHLKGKPWLGHILGPYNLDSLYLKILLSSLGCPLRVEVVHDDLGAVQLVPLVRSERTDERHAERVRLGEDVHVAQVSGEEERGVKYLDLHVLLMA